jgi:diguanylate cyclase (GGDEF)-like protein
VPITNLQTIVIITGLMGCLMTLVMFFLRKSYPKSIKGLDDWMLFPLLSFIASALYSTQLRWHHLVSMALPNFLLVIALLIQTRGTYWHFGRTLHRRWMGVALLLSLIFVLWTSGKSEYFNQRLVFVSGFTAAMLSSQLPLLWQSRKGSFAAYFMLCTMVLIILVMLARAATAVMDPAPVGIYTYSPMQAIYLATYSFGVLLLSISGILLASEQLRKEMERLITFDLLTGALTRGAALEYGEAELARIRRLGTHFSVLMFDIDHFKRVNDQYGHQVGDVVLTNVVRNVEQTLRRPSAIGRYGGEEFLVLLPDTSREQAFQVAQRIQQHLAQALAPPKVTISIGVACVGLSDTLYTAIGRADQALYTAKNNGRNTIVVEEAA